LATSTYGSVTASQEKKENPEESLRAASQNRFNVQTEVCNLDKKVGGEIGSKRGGIEGKTFWRFPNSLRLWFLGGEQWGARVKGR